MHAFQMEIAFLGYGHVVGALADRLQRLGHRVTLAAADAQSARVREVLVRSPLLGVSTPREAVERADVIFLATPFSANEAVLRPLSGELRGKILVDCTNPIGPGLTHALEGRQSGTERIQALLPETRVVKAFSIYGYENFENPSYPGYNVRPMMMFCGNDAPAKRTVEGLLD